MEIGWEAAWDTVSTLLLSWNAKVPWGPTLDWVKGFLNSGFISAALGGLAGAVGGAWAAQTIAERSKERDELLRQLHVTNAAVMTGFAICNTMITLKKQYVASLFAEFNKGKEAFIAHDAKLKESKGIGVEPIELALDLRTVQMPAVPFDVLRTQVYERLSVSSWVLLLTAQLGGAVTSLGASIDARNRLTTTFRGADGGKRPTWLFYFGLPFDGGLSTEFSDVITAIHRCTDDAIYFSSQLCEALSEQGKATRQRLMDKHGFRADKATAADFGKAAAQGLMPDEKEYEEFLEWKQASQV